MKATEKSRILNITNGDVFNAYFLSKEKATAVPFREAMMDGDTVADIFSKGFIRVRAAALGVDCKEYRASMAAYDAINSTDCTGIALWFGKDTFCQINLLTLLAYLEQINYRNDITLNYIDDETFEILQKDIPVSLGRYKTLYEDILMHGRHPKDTGVLLPDAIDLYFDYHSDNGLLARTVRAHADMNKMELIRLLLSISGKYGLSDVQAEKLIQKYRIK